MNFETKKYLQLTDFETKVLIEVVENALNTLESGAFQSYLNSKTIDKFCINLLSVLRNG